MNRVAWERYEGNDIEAVVAMLINREHPESTRITPSSGDGGVDILHRGGAPDGGDVVYQVKRHTAPLSTQQQDRVTESLGRVFSDERWAGLHVTQWRLVTPWDPTPEADGWLQTLGDQHDVDARWHGVTFVDNLAARYPEVVDYYLHGGRIEIQNAYERMAALFGLDGKTQSLDVPTVVARLAKARESLDSDPHYVYELRFGHGEPPVNVSRPHLMFTWMSIDTARGAWQAVDVIARCAVSVEERPILISGTFTADPNSCFANDLRDFVDYGAGFTSPAGAFDGVMDAPGGLGGPLVESTVRLLPLADAAGPDPDLLFESVSPDGAVLASTFVSRVDRSEGAVGMRVVLRQRNNLFTLEDRYRQDGNGRRTMTFGDATGHPVREARDGYAFLRTSRPPNRVRISRVSAGASSGAYDANWDYAAPDDVSEALRVLGELVGLLADMQEHTASVIRVPDLYEVTEKTRAHWQRVVRLLGGEDLVGTYPEGHALIIDATSEVEIENGTVVVPVPLRVTVGEQVVRFGNIYVWANDATLASRTEANGRAYHAFTTPDRKFRYRRQAPADS